MKYLKGFISRLDWHYDAIVNGGCPLSECIRVEYIILTSNEWGYGEDGEIIKFN